MINKLNQQKIKRAVLPILRAYGVRRADLFGSFARGTSDRGSDVDILVEVKKSFGLLEFVELRQKLSERLGRSVDLVEYDALKPRLRPYITRDLSSIL